MCKLDRGSHFEYVTGANVVTREQRMANDVQPYQFEPLMTAEELASYRERVSSIHEKDSSDHPE